ncbi:hypothetical protein [Streptomyces varsoviensis]|uniref:Uncharacterized protein n=1 Tax=Streptomyces varsoviensis TaxID=67373 RepID=A0ABR5IS99_9ACTN|nr:hypothetical protein [Streptomyces varsoviensis]KOG51868.1 hypothetical protein ADK38_44520 [Streptomyces varsoviensis]
MSADTHLQVPAPRTAQTRLPWWALVLPAVAFVALFALKVSPAAADSVNADAAAHALEWLRHIFGGVLS